MAKRIKLNKRSKGRGKGQQFERDVCRRLSLWVSGGKSKNLFWRSSQSGGRATTLRKKGERLASHAGDIAAIDPAGTAFIERFFIECKRYRNLHLDMLFYDVTGVFWPMWDKCKEQAEHYNKVPVLIFKENSRKELLCTDTRLGAALVALGVRSTCSFPAFDLYVFDMLEVFARPVRKVLACARRL